MPPQIMPFEHKNDVELNTIEKKHIQENISALPYLHKSRTYIYKGALPPLFARKDRS